MDKWFFSQCCCETTLIAFDSMPTMVFCLVYIWKAFETSFWLQMHGDSYQRKWAIVKNGAPPKINVSDNYLLMYIWSSLEMATFLVGSLKVLACSCGQHFLSLFIFCMLKFQCSLSLNLGLHLSKIILCILWRIANSYL